MLVNMVIELPRSVAALYICSHLSRHSAPSYRLLVLVQARTRCPNVQALWLSRLRSVSRHPRLDV